MGSIRGTGTNGITGVDVAACLTGLDRHTYLYGLAKYSLDRSVREELSLLAVSEAIQSGFKLETGESNRTIAILALTALEIAINPKNCTRCKGVGELKLMAKIEVCEGCQGAGSRAMGERTLAKMLGVTRFQARKVWAERLKTLLSGYLERDDRISFVIYMGLVGKHPSRRTQRG